MCLWPNVVRVQAGQDKSFLGHRAIIPRQMGRLCTVCAHPQRAAIDEDLKTDRPLRDMAARFGVSKAALHRHYHHRLPEAEALEESSAQGTVTLPRSESRSWTFPKWVWRQVWGRKGILAIVAGAIGYMARGLTPRR